MESFLAGGAGDARGRSAILLCFLLVALGLTGCLVRQRVRISEVVRTTPVWKTASLPDLLARLTRQQNAIQTLGVTALIEPSVSSPAKGEIVQYRDVRTFILIRKPGFIRMIGLYPVVENKAFDMASDGETFRLYIPSKNRFIIGKNSGENRSESALENLRPQVILQSLLIEGPEPGKEEAVLESFSDLENSYYIVHLIHAEPGQAPILARNIWFERRGLSVTRLEMFDPMGDEVTDVRYSNYADFAGIRYPQDIVVDRPKDFYGLHLAISDVQFNQPMTDDKFQLDQPPDTDLNNMGQQRPRKKESNVG